MSNLAALYRPLLSQWRGLVSSAGLRPFTVSVRVTSWTSAIPMVGGGKTYVDTPIREGGGNPKVRQITQRQIIASGGLYEDRDLRIGPLTPVFAGGGFDPTILDPVPGTTPAEIMFLITGPGTSPTGDWYREIARYIAENFSYWFTVRKTGEQGV